MITREALMILENELTFTKQVNREYSDQFAQTGGKIGNTINIRTPASYMVSSGPNLATQDFVEGQIPLIINQQKHVDVVFSSYELTLSLDDFSKRVLEPQIAQLANQIDADGLAQYVNVYNSVGAPGSANTTFAPFLQAGVLLDNNAAPRTGNARNIVLSPQGQADAVGGQFATVLNDQKTIGDQYLNGTMGRALGFKWSMDQNVAAQTVGPLGGTPVVNGAGQTGSTLVTNGWTAAAAARLSLGDIFTIAGVYQVNPLNKNSSGKLQQFVVTSAASSDGAGNATLNISPAIVVTGSLQNVTASPANAAAITVVGAANSTTPQALAFHRDAFTFASVDLEDVSKYGAWGARVSDKQLGISMRIARQYTISTDQIPCRVDVLYGWKTVRPAWATRLQGSNT
jgi:hypothetical protein